MKREMKIDNYKRIYNELQNDSDIQGLGYPENKDNLDFYGEIGKFKFEYSLMFEKDLLKIRAERNCPGTSDDILFRFARQMGEEGKNISPTAYDGKVILSTFYPFPGIETEVASENIYQTAKSFFDFLKYAEEKAKKFDSNIPVTKESAVKEKNITTEKKDSEISEELPPQKDETTITQKHESVGIIEPDERLAGLMKTESSCPEPRLNQSRVSSNTEIADAFLDFESDIKTSTVPKKEKKKHPKANQNNTLQKNKVIKQDMSDESVRLPYQPAPEIAKQMEDMYTSLNKTMKMKKDQLDLRENILNKKSAGIEKEQKRLEKERETLMEEKRILDNEREDLNKSWELYHESTELLQQEKATVEANTVEVHEKENSLRRREQSLNDKARNLDAKITGVNKKADSLAAMEKDLQAREKDVSERNSSLLSREQQIEIKQKQVNFLMEQVNVEREVIESRTADLKNLEQMLKEMEGNMIPIDELQYQEEIDNLKTEIQIATKQTEEQENTIILYKEKIRSLESENHVLLKDLKALELEVQNVDELQAQLDESRKQIVSLKSQPKADTLELSQLRNEIRELKDSGEQYKKSLADRDSDCESLKKERDDLIEKLSKYEKDSNPDAETLIGQLQSEGIRMERVAGEAPGLITGELEGCKIIVDTEQCVLCIQKPCKRNHVRELEKWTSENISECFYQAKGIVHGRKYSSKIEDIKAMVSRISPLK